MLRLKFMQPIGYLVLPSAYPVSRSVTLFKRLYQLAGEIPSLGITSSKISLECPGSLQRVNYTTFYGKIII